MNRYQEPSFLHPSQISEFKVAEWRIEPRMNCIHRDAQQVQLEPRVMHLLTCLATRPGKVILRQELLDAVWADTVVCEDSLSKAISDLRRALGDESKSPTFIETIRKSGYRLIAPVMHLQTSTQNDSARDGSPEPQGITRGSGAVDFKQRAVIIPAAFAIVFILLVLLWDEPQVTPMPLTQVLQSDPFTTYRGVESHPAISPDGSRVAFAWYRQKGEWGDIYIKQSNTETPLRLTQNNEEEVCPTWSPGGDTIAFARIGCEAMGIYTVPAIGGPVHCLVQHPLCGLGMDWAPGGGKLVFADTDQETGQHRIMTLAIDSGVVEQLTTPPNNSQGDIYPVFSPDGTRLAFARATGLDRYDLFLMPGAGGEPRQITHLTGRVAGMDWSAEGEYIVISLAVAGDLSLWRFSLADESLSLLQASGGDQINPSLSLSGNRLVYAEETSQFDILRIHVIDPATDNVSSEPFICSTHDDRWATFSPDGKRLAFISSRSGTDEIWIASADGSNPRQVTRLDGASVLMPHWSPDGNQLAFSALTKSGYQAFHIPIAGGQGQQLEINASNAIVQFWSDDGESIWLNVHDPAGWQLYQYSVTLGLAQTTGIADGWMARQSVDGEWLYYLKRNDARLHARPFAGGAERLLVESTFWPHIDQAYIPVQEGIYFVTLLEAELFLSFYDYSTEETMNRFKLALGDALHFAVHPDDGTILLDTRRREIDLMLVEQFK